MSKHLPAVLARSERLKFWIHRRNKHLFISKWRQGPSVWNIYVSHFAFDSYFDSAFDRKIPCDFKAILLQS